MWLGTAALQYIRFCLPHKHNLKYCINAFYGTFNESFGFNVIFGWTDTRQYQKELHKTKTLKLHSLPCDSCIAFLNRWKMSKCIETSLRFNRKVGTFSVFCRSIFFLFFSFPGILWFLNRYLLTQKLSKKNVLYEQMTCTFTTAQREVSHTMHLQHGNMAASLKVMTSSLLPPSVFSVLLMFSLISLCIFTEIAQCWTPRWSLWQSSPLPAPSQLH